ncbi:phosphomannomutase/phosphoglucomutase [Gilvimarinus agarilyticus]|uniref:phosphomannomutase/phosphoglucomutase n=1 Tax=Gilvimarinus sp. 2_MG-2023 TaxID=3062666 RepID=UPI001C0922E5|nr:phosphomannomutase/phosphoglucomutase [Gilvimarinus sp. 2_MG-2023]MBU2884579.1 phosphomannomutase/phosphoglucomutase [Gilvimarinus agarilyticus]MDO6569688.1 phosphomannomutase/phosphoglucomutase [Gilvimarinus sp. 2_MG-2023]
MSNKPGDEQTTNDPATAEQGKAKLTRGEKRAQEATKRFHARRHKALAIMVGLSLVLNAMLALWLYDVMVEQKQRARIEQNSQEYATGAANRLQRTIEQWHAELQKWANHPAVVSSIKTGDTDVAQQALVGITQGSDALVAVRAIPKGHEALVTDHAAPIGYAELDLIRRSTRRQETLAEAAPHDNSWQLQLAAPIPPEGEKTAAGSLLASYDGQALEAKIADTNIAMGEFRLQQTFSSPRALTVATTGTGNAGPSITAKVSGTYLSIHFTPSPLLIDNANELPGLWLLVISLCTTAGLALSLILARILIRPKQGPTGEGLVLPQQYKDTQAAEESSDDDIADTPQPSTLYQTQDILDISVVEEDADILGLDSAAPRKKAPAATKAATKTDNLPDEIFRAYDIRGKVDASGITPDVAQRIGLALGSEVQDQGESAIIVARDDRTHSPELCEHLINGILDTGCDVIYIGEVPTPLMHFATAEIEQTSSGVMVTASHNGPEDNGFKIVISGENLSDSGIKDLRSRITQERFLEGKGRQVREDISADYIERIFSDVALAGQLSVVIDAGNAVAGRIAPQLFEELGCDVVPLHCEPDGTFPNHMPDPSKPENLQDLIAKVQEVGADLGVAFDGDGDRVVVVTPAGSIIWPDQLLMLFAKDVLSRNPGADVLFDVKCSKQLNQLISSYGGRPIMWKTGHSHMKSKMVETGALLGGEYSGHIFFKERWYGFDDGLYAAARLMEIITLRDQSVDEAFAAFPMLPSTPEYRVAIADSEKFAFIEKLIEQGDFQTGKATTIDGLRVDFAKGWGLVRASNTAAELTLRFEAENEATIEKLKQLFKRELRKINKNLNLDF